MNLKLAVIYLGAPPFARNYSRSCFFLGKKMLVMSVRNHLIFQRGSELVLGSKAAKSLASQKVHHRVIYFYLQEATLSVLLAWTISSEDLEKELPRALQAALIEKS